MLRVEAHAHPQDDKMFNGSIYRHSNNFNNFECLEVLEIPTLYQFPKKRTIKIGLEQIDKTQNHNLTHENQTFLAQD